MRQDIHLAACVIHEKEGKMIPEIGLMIGCYIVAKLVYISGTDDATPVVKGLSAIAILVAFGVMVDLFMRGQKFPM